MFDNVTNPLGGMGVNPAFPQAQQFTNPMGMNTMPGANPAMPIMGSQVYGNLPQFNQNQVVNDQTIKINPQVMQLVSPIIETMTQYDMFQKSTPAFGLWNAKNSLDDYQNKRFEEAKKNCVHLIRDINSGQLVPTLEEFDDTKFKCRLCGRFVYKKFDESATEKLQEGIAVLNMLAFFGMSLNLSAEQMSKIIFLKSCIPDAIQLVAILNKFVKEEDNMISSGANIGEASRNAEFRAGQMVGFNSF
jgi:hypothetical protein